MKLGFSSWGMPTFSVDEILATLARIGFDAVELTVIPPWRTELDTLDADTRKHIRTLLRDYGLELPAIAGHRSLIAPDPGEHAENWRRLTGAIDLAVDLAGPGGPPALNTTPGGTSGDWERVRGLLADRTGDLCDYAGARGVVVAIEPHVHASVDTIDRALWLLEQVGRPNLKLAFDISHFNIQGVPIEESVAALAPQAACTHVKDERGQVPDFEFLIPGEGEFDYVRYLKAMAKAGYTGDITVEISVMVHKRPNYDPVAAAQQSHDVLSRAFVEAGIQRR